MNKFRTILIFIMMMSLIGCGPANNSKEQTKPPVDKPAPVNPQHPEQTDESDEPDEVDDAPIEAPPQTKLYYMNKNYIMKPIDNDDEAKVVLLTFDDGPKQAEMISSMIETLDKHHARAIFFVNGYRVKAQPELLRMLHDAGQIIGNHSWDHIELGKQSNEVIDQQLEDVQQIVQETIGVTPMFFRPPFASSNDYVKQKAHEQNMLFMTWSNGSLDWDSNNQSADKVIANVLDQLHPGSNILMHELPWTVDALDSLLTKLTDAGYSFLDPNLIDIDYDPDTAKKSEP